LFKLAPESIIKINMADQSKSLIKEKLEQLRREAEERDAKRRADKAGQPYANLITAPINIEALSLIDAETAQKAKAAAFEIKEQKVALAVFDPNNVQTKEVLKKLEQKGFQPSVFVVSLSGLNHIFSFYRFIPEKAKEITGSVRIAEKRLLELRDSLTSLENIKNEIQKIDIEAGQTTQILEIILAGALANRASDIHLEPAENKSKLRLRIDGLLHDVFNEIRTDVYQHILTRIKLLSGLKINIHDETQDGRFAIKFPGKEVEIRVAIGPAGFGEVAVMRLLDPDAININLAELGLRRDDLEIIETELNKPNGMILNTGPTGSGKTTTLYAFLQRQKNPETKIITIEDPIEYRVEGIEQTQIDNEAGYTFANGLRSLMRQDPDIILVGEIRDKETAEIGIQAALTGHLVFSTVHANEAAGAIPRLLDLGVRPLSIGSALNLIIAQRLVRRLCEFCKIRENINEELAKKIKEFFKQLPGRVSRENHKEVKIYRNRGCEKCSGFGFKGRIGVYELFLVGPEMEELISKETSEEKLQETALSRGLVTMQEDGLLKVLSGLTTFEEVEKITGPIKWINR